MQLHFSSKNNFDTWYIFFKHHGFSQILTSQLFHCVELSYLSFHDLGEETERESVCVYV